MIYTRLMGVDPGGTTGAALFKFEADYRGAEKNHELLAVAEIQFEDIFKFLKQNPVDIYVVENYRIRPARMQKSGYAHQWNKGEALQIIGAIRLLSEEYNREVILQEPNQKPVAYQILGVPYVKGKPGMHKYDAMAHAELYLHKLRHSDGNQ